MVDLPGNYGNYGNYGASALRHFDKLSDRKFSARKPSARKFSDRGVPADSVAAVAEPVEAPATD